jgi:MoaA/NifB/PqqE/SkfB family radical SAM enzyme
VKQAKSDLGFRGITMLTNGSLLHEHEAVLPFLDRLVISMDSPDPELWSSIINAPLRTTNHILDNIRRYAAEQRRYGYRMVLNCVLTPQTLSGARRVLELARENHLLVAFSPQAVMNWPSYDLLISQEYKDFLSYLITEKRSGAPILGSEAYLQTMRSFHPYACYPTLNPRVLPAGELVYPCRPIEKDGRGHGGRPCNLREVSTWDQAIRAAVDAFGTPPLVCTSCFQQCFAEPSLMQGHPLSWLAESTRYPASRQAGLNTFAPG